MQNVFERHYTKPTKPCQRTLFRGARSGRLTCFDRHVGDLRLSPLLADVNYTSINSFYVHYSERIHVKSIVFRNNISV